MHRDRPLARASVAELFWPDEEDEAARASLRRHLHRALAALPAAPHDRPWVLATKVTLRWNPDAGLDIDADDYDRLSAAGERESAVALYRGDYLEGFYDDWVLIERERLRDLQSANLVALVDQRRRALDYPAAIAFAQALQRLDPLREDAVRRLMSLRFVAGDRSGALAEFETFSRRLRDELAAEPMDETLALHDAIRSNDLNTLEGGAPARSAAPRFPFVGRDVPLQALRQLWESAARGTAMTAVVSGEAGIGKSRLIGELVALAEAQGGRVAFGTTAPIEAEPYQPVAEALRGALALLRLDRIEPVKLAALAALVPELRDVRPDLTALATLEPERNRHRLFDAVETAFEQLAEKRPLLIVLEDLHGAGAATIDLVRFVIGRLRSKSVLVVIAFREEEVDAGHALRTFVRRLDADRSQHIGIGPLDPADVVALVASAALVDGGALAHEIFVASEGNALFATELLREHVSAGGAMPGGIAEAVSARLRRLSAAARALAETAAVAGVGFDAEVVREASGWSFAEVFDALDELLDRALIRVSAQRRGDFSFSHQLVHAAVYDGIEPGARRALHRRIASTLERLFPDRPSLFAVAARHYDAAGMPDEAVARYVQATRYALDVFAQDEAIALATRALALSTDDRTRFALYRVREEAAARAGYAAVRRPDCDAMTEIAERCADEELLGTALCRALLLCFQQGDPDAEAAAIARLDELSRRSSSPRWALEAALARARTEIFRANHQGADALLAAVESLLQTPADEALAFEYWSIRTFAAGVFAPSRARDYLERARMLIGADRSREARALRMEAQIADYEGDARTLNEVAAKLLNAYTEIGDLEGQAVAHQNLAITAWYRFDVAANREHMDRAIAIFERVRKPQSVAAAVINRGVLAQQLGAFADAEADYLQARSTAAALNQHDLVCLATANLASLETLRGDHTRARALALEALDSAREHGLAVEENAALEYLAIAERDLGRFAVAREHHEAALGWRRERDPRGVLELLIEIIPTYLALGDVAAAVAAAEELLAGLEGDRGRVTFPAYALASAAAAFSAAGNRARAGELRSEARNLLHSLAARIGDEPSRRGYLGLSIHRSILDPAAPA